MRAKELLNLISEETWNRLAIETQVNKKTKKLEGKIVFSLLLYSILNVKENSLRVMERTFSSYLFQRLQSKPIAAKVRHSSLAERLRTINVAFFEMLYQDCLQSYAKYFDEKEKNILRFDSTIVSISAKLVDIGFICGGGHDNSRQLKFTVGYSALPEYISFNHAPTFNSENVALKHALLDCKSTKDKIVLFDRGLQARDAYDAITDNNILFITRTNPNPRAVEVSENKIKIPFQSADLIISEDSQKRLINRNGKKTKYAYRYIHTTHTKTSESIVFLTNIHTMNAEEIAAIYKRRWDIEVFFKFLKQELHFSHLLSRDENGIKVVMYTTLILSILLTVFKKLNNLKGYKIPKLDFALELEEELIKHIIKLHGGNPDTIVHHADSFWNTS
jgi:hypothetical protein